MLDVFCVIKEKNEFNGQRPMLLFDFDLSFSMALNWVEHRSVKLKHIFSRTNPGGNFQIPLFAPENETSHDLSRWGRQHDSRSFFKDFQGPEARLTGGDRRPRDGIDGSAGADASKGHGNVSQVSSR